MSLCAHAQALTFVPTQAIGGVHATAAEAVARALRPRSRGPPRTMFPRAPRRARVPVLRVARAPYPCPSTPTSKSPRRKCLTPEPTGSSVSTSFGPAVSPGSPALPGTAPRDECTRRRAPAFPSPPGALRGSRELQGGTRCGITDSLALSSPCCSARVFCTNSPVLLNIIIESTLRPIPVAPTFGWRRHP